MGSKHGMNDDGMDQVVVEIFHDEVLKVEGKHIEVRKEEEDSLPPPLPRPSTGLNKKLTFSLSPSRVRNMLFAEHESEATNSVLRGDFDQ